MLLCVFVPEHVRHRVGVFFSVFAEQVLCAHLRGDTRGRAFKCVSAGHAGGITERQIGVSGVARGESRSRPGTLTPSCVFEAASEVCLGEED